MASAEHHFVVIGTVENGRPIFTLADEQVTDNLFPDGMIYEDNEWITVDESSGETCDNDELIFNELSRRLSK